MNPWTLDAASAAGAAAPRPAGGQICDLSISVKSQPQYTAVSRYSSPDFGDAQLGPPPGDGCSRISLCVDVHEQHAGAGEDARPAVAPAGTTTPTSTLVVGAGDTQMDNLPNEILLHIMGYLDVNDLLSTSRVSHHFRCLSLAPVLHAYRLRHARTVLPPLLASPSRPTLAELIARSIFLTHTSVVSRRLARSLISIRLSRRLAARPTVEILVQRSVLPRECVPASILDNGGVHIAPALVARRKAVEKERVKDELRRWIGGVWKGQVRERAERVKKWDERFGVGRVWKLRRFWERVGKGERADTGFL